VKKRRILIGDVHGCIEELVALLEAVKPQEGDEFMFLGDLVDKGPKSLEVLRYVRNLISRYPGSLCVAGNHEEKSLRLYWQALNDKDAFGRASPKWQKIEPWREDTETLDWQFIESMPLVFKFEHEVTCGNCDGAFRPDKLHDPKCVACDGTTVLKERIILVHGGFYPKFFVDYPEGIGEAVMGAPVRSDWHKGGGKKMDRTRRFLRIRHVSPEGEQVTLGDEKPGDVPWADVYDGREGFAFYGHEPREEVKVSNNAMGLDTGAVLGGKLTAAILEPGIPCRSARIVQVQSKKYCEKREE
jgi:hypothetical protein